MRKEVTIIGGANGSGKSTFARFFNDRYPMDFLCADDIARDLNAQNVDRVKLEAGRVFFKRIDALLETDKNFLVESTLSGKYLVKLINRSKEKGYLVKIIYIFLENPAICIERIKERVIKGGHFVPTPDVIRRYFRSKKNFWNQYKTLADMWCLVYNSEEQFIEIAIGAKEEYIVNSSVLFEKFLDIVGETE